MAAATFSRSIDPCEWAMHGGEILGDPQTYREAINSPDAAEWQHTMQQEYDSLTSRKTWMLTTLPCRTHGSQVKVVFKTKYNDDCSLARLKARVVAKGFPQIEGIDFTETFAPTVKFTTLRVLFSISAHLRLHLEHINVDCAFMYAILREEVYMEQP